MNIKSLLLTSAALIVTVTGARAADAVVMVEPEPVEYVRVCDVYGSGFFYIPGTETCLQISGYVRMRLLANDEEFNEDPDGVEDYRFGTEVRARLDFDAREETELGTLRGKVRMESTNSSGGFSGGTGGADFTAEEAYIQLGGLTIGFLDSAWTNDDGGIEDGLLTDEADWAAGDFTANRISYTYASNGLSGTLSVEDDGDGDFTPDVIGKLAYAGGFGGAYLMGVFDEDSGDFVNSRLGFGPADSFGEFEFFTDELDAAGGDEAFVLKAGILLENLVAEDSAFKIEGHYAFDPSVYALVDTVGLYSFAGTNNFDSDGADGFAIPSEYQIGAGYSQQFGKLSLAASGVYGETFDLSATYAGVTGLGAPVVFASNDIGSTEYFGVAGNVGYDITQNFSVLGEVSYVDLDLPSGIDDFDQTRGFLEFQRQF